LSLRLWNALCDEFFIKLFRLIAVFINFFRLIAGFKNSTEEWGFSGGTFGHEKKKEELLVSHFVGSLFQIRLSIEEQMDLDLESNPFTGLL
jgi:hypothetical protein